MNREKWFIWEELGMCLNMIKLNSQRINITVIKYVCFSYLYSVWDNWNFEYFCLVTFFGYRILQLQMFLLVLWNIIYSNVSVPYSMFLFTHAGLLHHAP